MTAAELALVYNKAARLKKLGAGMKYKLIIYGNNMYKEFDFTDDFTGSLTIGTDKACQIAFRRERFLTGFIFRIDRQESGEYIISCSDSVYLTSGYNIKEYIKNLQVGEHLSLCYDSTGTEVFGIDFIQCFDPVGDDYDKAINIGNTTEISIGGQVNCSIRIDNPYVNDDKIVLRKAIGGYEINLNETGIGVEINGFIPKTKTFFLREGEFLSIKGYSFCIGKGILYTSRNASIITQFTSDIVSYQKNHFRYPKFIKNARQRFVLPSDKLEVLNPQNKDESEQQNFLFSVLPMLVNMVMMIGMRGMMGGGRNMGYILFFVGTMSVSTTITIINFVKEKKKRIEKEEKRKKVYMNYLAKKEDEIISLRKRERVVADYMNPSLEDYMTFVEDFDNRLFEKKKEHDDYLKVRIGEGTVASNCQVEFKKEDYVDSEDELKDYPEAIHDKYEYIENMPVCLDLKEKNAVGFIGNRTKLYQMEKNLIMEFAASHFYKDMKLFLIMNDEDTKLFSWARWLQITYNENNGMRNFMYDKESNKLTLEFLYSELSMRESLGGVAEGMNDYVVLVFRSELISNHPVSKYIEKASDLGFHFVFFEEYEEFINPECSSRIFLNKDDYSGYIQEIENGEAIQAFNYEHISLKNAELAAKKLACVYVDEVSLENSLTKNITLFKLLNILSPYDLNLSERWERSKIYKSMAAPIGVKSGDEVVYLDLHEKYHGPHGLVAGTTGSGKSEILQTYILSMASLFHPYEVGFIIIDFKGGGMVNQFKDLPHLNGAITNIDGNEIERSLLSIKAELIKRQELFAEQEVNHIDDYIKNYKEGKANIPLPHLILIVDEFAELKSEQPEFMKELISAARIGRSLGVHLILATQKPSGVVSDQIWSNSKFKLCLKVQNKQDSNEVLKSPLAAEIKEPGRAYLQVGNNEIFELFQSAYSGASAKNDGITAQRKFKITSVELSGKRTVIYEQKPDQDDSGETQLKALVNYINEYCENAGIKRLPNICLPSLPEAIPIETEVLDYDGTDIVVPVGMVDDPSRQRQYKEIFNITQNNIFILGATQSGKTNLLQTLIRGLAERYSPKEVNIYILDFASTILKNFETLNHVGGVIISSDEEKLKGFLKLMAATVQERKKLFSKLGLSSFSAYRESGQRELPQIVIMLDNWVSFRSYFPDYEDVIINLSRESIAVGISIIVTAGQATGTGFKLLANFPKRTGLYCNDSSDYGMLFEGCRKKINNIAGRALIENNKNFYEIQYYLAFAAEKEFEKINLMKDFIDHIQQKYGDQYVAGIQEIPEHVTERYMIKQFANNFKDYEIPLGMEYNSIDKRVISCNDVFVQGFLGEKSVARRKYIEYAVNRLLKNKENNPVEIYLMDDPMGEFKNLSDKVDGYINSAEEAGNIINSVAARLEERMKKSEAGELDLSKEAMLLILVNSSELANLIGKDTAISIKYKLIASKYKNLKVAFWLTNLTNEAITFSAGDLLRAVRDGKKLVAFEDIKNIKVVDVSFTEQKEFKKALDTYDAYFFNNDKIEKIRVVED